MTLPPTIVRELRVTARRAGTYWIRALIAGLAILACLHWFLSPTLASNPAAVGRAVFNLLSLLGVILAAGACILTADSISSERRHGTLGLLFLASLESRQVVLGKLAVFGFATIYTLLGLAPALMLSLSAGGITGGEVVRMMILLLNFLLLSLTSGLLASAVSWNQSVAVMKALGLMLLVAVGPFAVEAISGLVLPLKLSHASVISGFMASSSATYPADPARYWVSVLSTHLAAWGFLALSSLALQRNWTWAEVPRALKAPPPRNRRLLGSPRAVIIGGQFRHRTFAPVARALLRQRGQRPLAWVAATVCFLGSIATLAAIAGLRSLSAATSIGALFNLAGLTLFAMVAGRFFMDSRQTGELELLLVTPVGARGVLREHRMALHRLLLGPIYMVTLGAFLVAVAGFHLNSDQPFRTLLSGLGHLAGTVLGVLATIRVAMLFGARSRNYWTLLGSTIGLVLLAPTVVIDLLGFIVPAPLAAARLWVPLRGLLFAATNIGLIVWAGRRLRCEFRSNDRSRLDRWFDWHHWWASGKLRRDLEPA